MKDSNNTASIAGALVRKFIAAKPRFTNPQDLIRHWIEVANHPERFIADPSIIKIRRRRAQAIQNLRRLAARYPGVADQLLSETSVSQEAA